MRFAMQFAMLKINSFFYLGRANLYFQIAPGNVTIAPNPQQLLDSSSFTAAGCPVERNEE